MTHPEPSTQDHNAPWNTEGEECFCSHCEAERRREAREERKIEGYEFYE